jgi:hypothetical protein
VPNRSITLGYDAAIEALAERRVKPPVQIQNDTLPAHSPMWFYCRSCGHLADKKQECYLFQPKGLCTECEGLADMGWLQTQTTETK